MVPFQELELGVNKKMEGPKAVAPIPCQLQAVHGVGQLLSVQVLKL